MVADYGPGFNGRTNTYAYDDVNRLLSKTPDAYFVEKGLGASQVQFNGSTAPISSWSDTSISAVVPSNATSGPVTVLVSGVTSNGVPFTVEGAPAIASFSPAAAPFGSPVTITGSGFGATKSNSSVQFNGGVATTVSSWSDTEIVALVPDDAATGPVSVTVGGLSGSSDDSFLVQSATRLTDSLGHVSSYSASMCGFLLKPITVPA